MPPSESEQAQPSSALLPLRLARFLGAALTLWLGHAVFTRIFPEEAGLPAAQRTVQVVELDEAAFRARLRDAVRTSLTPEQRCRRLGLMDLGLVSSVEPRLPGHGILDRLVGEETPPAFYVPGSDSVFVSSRQRAIVRHEMVHAIEDQYSTRQQEAETATTDRRIAMRAAIEGTAVVLAGGGARPGRFGGNMDVNAWILAYALGPEFMRASVERDPVAAFGVRPRTTYEVLFREPPASRAVLPPEEPGDGETLLCSDELGILGLTSALRSTGATSQEAETVGRAWRADRLDVLSVGMGRRVVWSVAFADPAARDLWLRVPGVSLPLTSKGVTLRTVLVADPERDRTEESAPTPATRLRSLGR
jgi:hypothetical protein